MSAFVGDGMKGRSWRKHFDRAMAAKDFSSQMGIVLYEGPGGGNMRKFRLCYGLLQLFYRLPQWRRRGSLVGLFRDINENFPEYWPFAVKTLRRSGYLRATLRRLEKIEGFL